VGTRNGPSCTCCNQPPCYCACPNNIGYPLSITIDLATHSGTQDCNICEWASGTYYPDPCLGVDSGTETDRCGDPSHKWNTPSSSYNPAAEFYGYCRWSYTNRFDFSAPPDLTCSITGTSFNDWKKIGATATIYVDCRSYCAYEKDGVIYDSEVEGSKLAGRALEVRLKISILLYHFGYGGCGFIKDPSWSREEAEFYGCQELYENARLYADSYGVMVPGFTYQDSYEQCCVYDPPYDPYPLGNCGIDDPYNLGAGYADLVMVWRTVNSLNHECGGETESLRFVPEESYSYRYYEEDGVCTQHELCDAPLIITWEM